MGHYVHHCVCVRVCVGAGRVGDTEADRRPVRLADRRTADKAVAPSSGTTSSQAKVSPRPAGWSHQAAVYVFIPFSPSLTLSHSLSVLVISACVFVCKGEEGVPLTCRCEFITSSDLLQVGTLLHSHL